MAASNRVSALRSLNEGVKPPTPQQTLDGYKQQSQPREVQGPRTDEPRPMPGVAQPCTISGIVILVEKAKKTPQGKWTNGGFVISTSKSQKRFWVHPYSGGGYCSIHAEDLIELKGMFVPSEDAPYKCEYEVWFNEIPMIEPSVTKSSIVSLILATFPRRGTLCIDDANRVYDKLATKSGDMEEYQSMDVADRVNLYMTSLSNSYNKYGADSGAVDEFYPILDKKKATKILKDWYNKRVSRLLYMLGLSRDEIRESTIEPTILYEKLKANPYTVPFISIKRAHDLSMRYRLGITDDQVRKGEILRHVYTNQTDNLWMGTPMDDIKRKFKDFECYREELIGETDIEGHTKYGWDLRIGECNGKRLLCMRQAYEAEIYVRDYMTQVVKLWNEKPRELIEPVYKMQTLSDDQKTAITGVLNHPIGIMMGNPGCGKTSCLIEILNNIILRRAEVMIAAFTGVAISRVTEVLEDAGVPRHIIDRAGTFHRLIHRGVVGVDDNDVTHLIVDENSFTSTSIFAELLHKFQNIRWMLFIGDNKQLQTLSHGQFFNEIIASEAIPTYILTKCHRVYEVEGEEDGVLANVNTMSTIGKDVPFTFTHTKNFQVIDGGNEQEVIDLMTSFRDAEISARDMCIVTPYNAVRERLAELHNEVFYAGKPCVKDSAGMTFYLHSVVLCTENNYDVDGNLYNGECGVVLDVNQRYIRVTFDRDAMTCAENELGKHRFRRTFNFVTQFTVDDGDYGRKQDRFRKNRDKPFYGNGYSKWGNGYGEEDEPEDTLTTKMLLGGSVKSVHRSQGTEKNHVIVYVPPGKKPSRRFLCQNILLVAISRAKRSCFVVGDEYTLEKVAITRTLPRHDLLGEYLRGTLGKTLDGMDTRCVSIGTYDESEIGAKDYFAWDEDDFD